ncbi:unnamed protein product [Effrenium voratum]|nr:unnamed protein product [Effrenium voratum]|mmetsp:Transcript_100140/g.238752  ORF Transcript_100140/g.238752 Transcript_100140/m.238752 type:complete len:230 (+) Transcript_100140:29-718(+)
MPRKAFRELDYEERVEPGAPQARRSRKAFRELPEDEDLTQFAVVVPATVCVLLNALLAVQLGALQGHLPVNFLLEVIYLAVTTVLAALIDRHALLHMFLDSRARVLNCSAAMGVILSVLKLSLVHEATWNSGLGELNLIRSWRLESFYGSACCMYLATYFAMKVLHNEEFCIDRAAKKMTAYAVSGIALGIFSGLFAVSSSLGWLVVLHAMLMAWSVSQCRLHRKGSYA